MSDDVVSKASQVIHAYLMKCEGSIEPLVIAEQLRAAHLLTSPFAYDALKVFRELKRTP